MNEDREAFYAQRDQRTEEFGVDLSILEKPVLIAASDDMAESAAGQLAILGLVNMAARAHRHVQLEVPSAPLLVRSLVPSEDLATACAELAIAINPFIQLEEVNRSEVVASVGFGRTGDVQRYITFSRWIAEVTESPAEKSAEGDAVGAGLGACLGAAVLFRLAHGYAPEDLRVSAWNFEEGAAAQEGPQVPEVLDVGNVVMVGAGAVGSSLAYWLGFFDRVGQWWVVDGDFVELHNTNRGLGLLAIDAGWPSLTSQKKALPAARLISATAYEDWYESWCEDFPDFRPDLVLALANGVGVRAAVGALGMPLLMHASTSSNWTAELHRHVASRDDCIVCRTGDLPETQLTCASGNPNPGHSEGNDAALPFLSGTAGLLLLAALLQLQIGEHREGRHNHWRLHLELASRLWQRSIRQCREGCERVLGPSLLDQLNAGNRWNSMRDS